MVCLMSKISSSLAEVIKVTLMSILLRSSVRVVSRIALEKEIRPITKRVTIIIKTEASVTVLSLQKLKKPVRRILFNFVQNICLLLIYSELIELYKIFARPVITDDFTTLYGYDAPL